jgi:hypothetical protein
MKSTQITSMFQEKDDTNMVFKQGQHVALTMLDVGPTCWFCLTF